MLAAECMILLVKTQSMRHKMKSVIDNVSAEQKHRLEERKKELEEEMKDRARTLESEYRALLEETRKNNQELEAKIRDASYSIEKSRLSARQAADEAALFARRMEKFKKLEKEYAGKLAALSDLDIESLYDEAKREISRKCEEDLAWYKLELFKKSGKELEGEARRILLDTILRSALSVNSEVNACLVKLPNEAMKGRLIGKEGRNIRSFEATSGTTLVIDETPDSVMISSFDPARREIAKTALESLVADGRINPATIESALAAAKTNIENHAWTTARTPPSSST